jgi:hypothetical protein
VFLIASALLLGAGLVGPCMEIEPRFGGLQGWMRLLKPAATQPTQYSVIAASSRS